MSPCESQDGLLAVIVALGEQQPSQLRKLVLDRVHSKFGVTPNAVLKLADACPALAELHLMSSHLFRCQFSQFLAFVEALLTLGSLLPTMKLVLPGRYAYSGPRISPSPQEALHQLVPGLVVEDGGP